MKQEVKVPSVGESVKEAQIESWQKSNGDHVQKGDIIAVLETDKASMDIPAESSGQLSILKEQGSTVAVGEVIATIDTAQQGKAHSSVQKPSFPQAAPQTQTSSQTIPQAQDSPSSQKLKTSPSVRRWLGENQMDSSQFKPSDQSDRLTMDDVNKPLDSPRLQSSNKEQQREAMSSLRKRIAERLVQSQHTTATLTTFNEADMSRIIELRKKHQDLFVKKYGFKLGFMSFFIKAVIHALKKYPKVNAFIDGTDIVYNSSYNIGVAVSTDKGLVVPVIFNAEQLSLAQIEKQILDYKDKALQKKLIPDDLLGGTFTVSNGGVFGSLLSTPILNPPQSGILGMHKIEQRPVVINNKIEIRPMMYLALSYDHRMVDGKESVGFLVKVKEGLEEPASLLIDM